MIYNWKGLDWVGLDTDKHESPIFFYQNDAMELECKKSRSSTRAMITTKMCQ